MASKLGTPLVGPVLSQIFGAASYTPPATLQIALFVVAPTDYNTGLGGTEATGGSYARASVANNATNFPPTATRTTSNGTQISYPTPTASWGTVVAFGVYNATGGAWLTGGDLTTNQTTVTGNPVQIAIGQFVIGLP